MTEVTDQWNNSFTSKLWTLIAVIILTNLILKRIKYYSLLPPGPWGLPVVGYLPWMWNSAPHQTYLKLAAKFGDVTSLSLGRDLVVCLGSAQLVKEYFNRADSTERPHTPLNDLMEGRGIILSEGDLWKRQRQYLHRVFQNLGVSLNKNSKFQDVILSEIEIMRMKLDKTNGAAIDPVELFGRHVHNIICQLIMSFRFKEGDKKFTEFNERITEGMRLFGEIHISEHLPVYLCLPGKSEVMDKIKSNLGQVVNFHQEQIEERKLDRKSKPKEFRKFNDLLDCYLNEIFENEKSSEIFPGCKDSDAKVQQMVQVMNDLFSAGMETVRTSLAWLLVMMVREPAAAAAVRAELALVVRPGQLVTLKHRAQLVYLQAVISETLRRVSVVPLGTTHVNSSNWNIGNFVIPEGTHIVPLINKIHMDPKYFPDPECFKPERFIKDGKLEVNDSFLAFGVGRRVCLGQQLARMELILFFANIMNSFDFSLADDDEIPSLDGQLGITHAPRPYKLCFKSL